MRIIKTNVMFTIDMESCRDNDEIFKIIFASYEQSRHHHVRANCPACLCVYSSVYYDDVSFYHFNVWTHVIYVF